MPRSVFGHPTYPALTAVAMVALCGAAAPVCGQCQLDKFLAHDSANLDVFGQAIAIDGNRVAIGAPSVSENSNGSAYVFRRVGSIWVQEAVITASDGAPDDEFGHSVAICGDFLAVGARLDDDNGQSSGSAYVFQRIGAEWLQINKLTASDAADDDQFGNAIAISCTTERRLRHSQRIGVRLPPRRGSLDRGGQAVGLRRSGVGPVRLLDRDVW